MRQLSITITWGEQTLCHRLLDPGEEFRLGDVADDFAVPESGLEGATVAYAVDREGRATICWDGQEAQLEAGRRYVLELGEVVVRAQLASVTKLPRAHRRLGRLFVAQSLSAAMVLGGLAVSAWWIPSAESVAEDDSARIELMRHYLMAAEETEQELAEAEDASDKEIDGKEGGTGTRAKGEEGSMGAPGSKLSGNRYGVAGPPGNPDPHIARQQALRDAAEFGMIGLMNTGAGGDPDAPTAPWGRDDSLGNDPLSAKGNMWGSSVDDPMGAAPGGAPGAGTFVNYGYNKPVDAREDRVSTFAIDVDTGSFPMVRRSLETGYAVNPHMVRPEEIVNYFDYRYPGPEDDAAFTAHVHSAPSPFDAGHEIVRVGIQARRMHPTERKPAHLVYLVDTSGSMSGQMPLVKDSLRMLTNALRQGDTVALCTYAGEVREVLAPTGIDRRGQILKAIESLNSSGGTAMSDGVTLAYNLASRTLVQGHTNRIIVLSDGDANIGDTSHEQILKTIDAQRRRGITLSTVGYGYGNYNDAMMEQLADKGDGNYRYVDGRGEAKRVFVEQLDGMLEVVAKDVKIQVDFDPRIVKSYRLIGYENRDVADKDFRNDAVDGGEIGAGHNATAIYDVQFRQVRMAVAGERWVTVRMRHKAPGGGTASEQAFPLAHMHDDFAKADASFRFATAAAGFAEILRKSPYAQKWSMTHIANMAEGSQDGFHDRAQLVALARQVGKRG